jgi:hypothetical protein
MRHLNTVCRVRVEPAWYCTECDLIEMDRDSMIHHICKENTDEVPVDDFPRPAHGMQFKP